MSLGERRISHGNKSDGTIKSGVAGRMACRTKGIVEEREGVHAAARPVKPAAPGYALGKSREVLHVRWPEWQRNARRSFRRPKPAHCLSLHVRSGLEGRLPELLFHFRSYRRERCALGGARRRPGLRFPRSAL